jgi:hypothetical protein
MLFKREAANIMTVKRYVQTHSCSHFWKNKITEGYKDAYQSTSNEIQEEPSSCHLEDL